MYSTKQAGKQAKRANVLLFLIEWKEVRDIGKKSKSYEFMIKDLQNESVNLKGKATEQAYKNILSKLKEKNNTNVINLF